MQDQTILEKTPQNKLSPLSIFIILCIAITLIWTILLWANYFFQSDDIMMSAEAFPTGNFAIASAYESEATKLVGLSPTDTIITFAVDGDSELITYTVGGYSAGLVKLSGQYYGYMSSLNTSFFKIHGELPQDNDLISIKNDFKRWMLPVDKKGSHIVGKSDDGMDVIAYNRSDGTDGFAYVKPGTKEVLRMEVFQKYLDSENKTREEHFLIVKNQPMHITLPDEWVEKDVEEISAEDFSMKLAMFISVGTAYTSQGLDADSVNDILNQKLQ